MRTRIEQTPDHPDHDALETIPLGMRVAAAWSWRLLLIGTAVSALIWLIAQVTILVVPIVIAILLSALLRPIAHAFERVGLPHSVGVLAALITFTIAAGGLVWLVVSQLRAGFDDVAQRSQRAWKDILAWVESSPFGLEATQVNSFVTQIIRTVETHQDQLWSGALAVTTTATHVATGTLLTIFALIFFMIDGKRIWFWVLGFFPKQAHAAADAAGKTAWVSLGQYARVQVLVAFIDAVGIGAGAAILGVPLPIPIAIFVFLGAFIPFLGAIITGALAAFIALVYNGPVNALIMLGVVILVNQLEGHVLQPLVMGNAVRVHPLGVVLAVSAGALLAGIPGALFAVPLTAATSAIVNTLVQHRWEAGTDPVAEYHKKNQVHHEARHRARVTARLRRGNTAAISNKENA